MASGEDPCPVYDGRTNRSQLRYCFYRAHHGHGAPDDSQWIEGLSEAEEFSIFDLADEHEIADEKGHLYGIRVGPELHDVLDLGTEGEQIAKFWKAREGQPWHGFPLWPLRDDAPANRKKTVLPKAVLERFAQVDLILRALREGHVQAGLWHGPLSTWGTDSRRCETFQTLIMTREFVASLLRAEFSSWEICPGTVLTSWPRTWRRIPRC